jgi:hypothetical protein
VEESKHTEPKSHVSPLRAVLSPQKSCEEGELEPPEVALLLEAEAGFLQVSVQAALLAML